MGGAGRRESQHLARPESGIEQQLGRCVCFGARSVRWLQQSSTVAATAVTLLAKPWRWQTKPARLRFAYSRFATQTAASNVLCLLHHPFKSIFVRHTRCAREPRQYQSPLQGSVPPKRSSGKILRNGTAAMRQLSNASGAPARQVAGVSSLVACQSLLSRRTPYAISRERERTFQGKAGVAS